MSHSSKGLINRALAARIALMSILIPGIPTQATCNGIASPVTLEVETKRGVGIPSWIPLPWLPVGAWILGECDNLDIQILGADWEAYAEYGGSTISYRVGLDITKVYEYSIDLITGLPNNVALPVEISCYDWDIVHARGGPSAYSVQIGDVGGPFIQTAKGTIRYCDEITIQSTESTIIELPYSMSASLIAAESFGDPEETKGIARAKVNGAVGGVSVLLEEGEVESVSVMPTTLDFSSSGVLSIPVNVGETIIQVDLEAEVYVEAIARCAGWFCIITASSTAAVNMPGSFIIGNYQGEGGGPLPECISGIWSDRTGVTYHGTGIEAPTVSIVCDANGMFLFWNHVDQATSYEIFEVGYSSPPVHLGQTTGTMFDLSSYLELPPTETQTILFQVKAVR